VSEDAQPIVLLGTKSWLCFFIAADGNSGKVVIGKEGDIF
jgi:hypothetical protein